ncbi:unnamed protein product [Triticum turgidum subsp. durum]|uniref:Coiled-coil domain-containing protein SCD2 n=1 Tax=Triticum turgidum subsp. durum TaxID=4567 RepID=A0A9R0QMQ3_TRITD|nr:unnamed protein product [Triticum turgidum subsp. durum]
MIPSIKQSNRPATSGTGSESSVSVPNRREQRRSVDLGSSMRGRRSSSSLNDEINTLQMENDSMYEKLQLEEDRCYEADAAGMGDAIEPEVNLISRKAAALEQRRASMRIASRRGNSASCDEITALRSEAKVAGEMATSVSRRVGIGSELRSLHATSNRTILSQEEMEEVVLKRCWLARYWKLSVRLGIHSDIAAQKLEHWSSVAPLALEVVLSIGQKARDGSLSADNDVNDTAGDGNIESMLLVEKGLRELASLKVEDAIMLALAEHRRYRPLSGPVFPADSHSSPESTELSEDERDDVRFKQAWLTYFWRRAKNHDVEEDIADDRLQFWIEQGNHPVTTSDVVEVDRGLHELKKLGIESQLWEATRRAFDDESINHGSPFGSEV